MNNTVPIEYGEFVGQPVEVPAMRVAGVPQQAARELSIERIIEIAVAARSGEPGREGYILPVRFARAIEAEVRALAPSPASTQPEAEKADAVDAKSRPFGCALAMGVLQSDLYRQLDDVQRAECDELVRRNLEWFKADAAIATVEKPHAE